MAAPHLEIYLEVHKIMSEELTIAIGNAKPSSILGAHELWTNHLPSHLLKRASQIMEAIAEATYQLAEGIAPEEGRGMCGIAKALKYKWQVHCPMHHSFGVV